MLYLFADSFLSFPHQMIIVCRGAALCKVEAWEHAAGRRPRRAMSHIDAPSTFPGRAFEYVRRKPGPCLSSLTHSLLSGPSVQWAAVAAAGRGQLLGCVRITERATTEFVPFPSPREHFPSFPFSFEG